MDHDLNRRHKIFGKAIFVFKYGGDKNEKSQNLNTVSMFCNQCFFVLRRCSYKSTDLKVINRSFDPRATMDRVVKVTNVDRPNGNAYQGDDLKIIDGYLRFYQDLLRLLILINKETLS